MKKTLAAVAVLGAFAGSALAADVTLYGRVDLGLQYVHSDKGDTSTDSWSLNSGNATSSRFGIKGSEQISEGLTVGFTLEQGFNADDGAEADSTKAFSRESRLYVATDYGTLHMGRFGALDAATGSLDYTGWLSASGTGYGTNINDHGRVLKTHSRLDNSIAYTSPSFAGVTVAAMASLGQSDYMKDGAPVTVEGDEASSTIDRYYGLGVKGQWGALGAGLVVSQVDVGSKQTPAAEDDAMNVTAGVNYDFGVAKAFLAANYYDQGQVNATTEKSQWGVSASVKAPIGSGTLESAVGYGVQTSEVVATGAETETKILNIGAFYKYPLSKRTYVYVGAGYDQSEEDGKDKVKTTEVISGIAHHF